MEDYSRQRHEAAGYEFVNSPHITKADLFETSGHLQWFADGMFPPMELDGGTQVLPEADELPVPHPDLPSQTRSYRDLPLRLFEFGSVYRYENSGVVHGLTRVRGMTQDDAHIFFTHEQMVDGAAVAARRSCSTCCATSDYRLLPRAVDEPRGQGRRHRRRVGRGHRGPAHRGLNMGLELVIDEGGGAFYGPKISVQARDAIGRTWQMSTIQVDFQMPQRFEHGVRRRRQRAPPADHDPPRAVRVDRAFLRHARRALRGRVPAWLAPVQVTVLPVPTGTTPTRPHSSTGCSPTASAPTCRRIAATLGARIGRAKREKVPYVLVVGDSDGEAGTVGVNARGGDEPERDVPVDTFIERLASTSPNDGDACDTGRSMTLERLWAGWRERYVANRVAFPISTASCAHCARSRRTVSIPPRRWSSSAPTRR